MLNFFGLKPLIGCVGIGLKVLILFFVVGTQLMFSQSRKINSESNESGQYTQNFDEVHQDTALVHSVTTFDNLKQIHQEEMRALTDSLLDAAKRKSVSGWVVHKSVWILVVATIISWIFTIVLIRQNSRLRNNLMLFKESNYNIPEISQGEVEIPQEDNSTATKNEPIEWLEKAKLIALEKLDDPVFCLESWSEAMGTGRRQFQRKLKASTGETATEYLHELRLQRARSLLDLEEKIPIRQLANAIGLRDVKYFSREFKKRYGMTPSQYQKKRDENK
ncbi:MAG: helix-turn-helix transcriptional regulator [Saprospiraceae bacterium]|nr:helix-turn-helix transcriptional regulator [Saprospiraceae bacterium]